MTILAKLVEYPHEKVVPISDLSEAGLGHALSRARELVAVLEQVIAVRESDKAKADAAPRNFDRFALNAFLDKAGYRRAGDLVHLTPLQGSITKEIRDSEKAAVAVISMEARETLVFKPSGASLARFRKNPVVLYNHDYEGLPVARSLWERVRHDDNGPGLVAKPQFHRDTELSREVWQLVADGALVSWELGVIPMEWEKCATGYFVTKWDILEYSVVPSQTTLPVLQHAMCESQITSPSLVKSIRAMSGTRAD